MADYHKEPFLPQIFVVYSSPFFPCLVAREKDGSGGGFLDRPLPQPHKVRADAHGPAEHQRQRENFAVGRRGLSRDATAALQVFHAKVGLFSDHVLGNTKTAVGMSRSFLLFSLSKLQQS